MSRIRAAGGWLVAVVLVVVLVAVLVVGIGIAPGIGPDAGSGSGAPEADDTDDTTPTESGADADDGSDLGREETPTDVPGGELRIRYLDVGQADATVVEFPNGEAMLVDSGDWRDDGKRVLTALREQDVERIDHLVSTHAHADHIGGHEAVIDAYETEYDGIGAVYDSGVVHTSRTYERYLDAVERHDVTLYEVREGDAIDVGAASVEFHNPPADTAGEDLDGNGVALTVEYGDRTALFTGDAEAATEARMVEARGDALASDVYQVGHHGSATSSSDPLLATVDPKVAVISSARDSQYGHPHEEVLASFADRGIETYWTAVHGDVVVTTDGRELSVAPAEEFSTDPEDLREERPDADERRELADPTIDARAVPTPPPWTGATPAWSTGSSTARQP
ncbi:ComEC/Rec2 family competence protein [Saliphagus sp. LR7]|uniref:ComEC/Rec2 family competence protein n=1 Tax=Saliphagus sp. LR7 TaxID=2282654 RepID=UPI000DF7AA2C|nr:ComEC/Rec2 family competence protein [Saliphagus sp. LR7]